MGQEAVRRDEEQGAREHHPWLLREGAPPAEPAPMPMSVMATVWPPRGCQRLIEVGTRS